MIFVEQFLKYMKKRIQVALVGDYDEKIYTHVKLNEAIRHSKPFLHFSLETSWVPTEQITENFLADHSFEGFWIAPGSPYKNDEGVYKLIQWARENNFPLFGTCGGFQYMIVEYARNVLRFSHATHAETNPEGEQLIVSKLSCSLKGQQEEVVITDPQSWLHEVLEKDKFLGYYNCSYGVNSVYLSVLNQYPLIFTAFSPAGEPRAFELKPHRFFKGTLFQPPLDSTSQEPNPLIVSFFNKCSLA
jgi:CTP synthase (UTP-ammonia lyase)